MISMRKIIEHYLSDNKVLKREYLKRYYRSYIGLFLMGKANLYKLKIPHKFWIRLLKELNQCISINNLFLTGLIIFPGFLLKGLFRINQFFYVSRNVR